VGAALRRDFAAAVESHRKIVGQSPDSDKAHAYLDLGRAYEKNEEISKAIESYLEAAGRDSRSAAAFLRLGVLYGRQQDSANAMESFDRAESIYKNLGNIEGVAEVLYERGAFFNSMDKVAEARQQLEKALEAANITNNVYQKVKTLLQLSTLAWGEADPDRAKRYATDAIELAEANDIENLATGGLIDLGAVYYSRAEYGEANKYFLRALEQAKKYKARRNEARASVALANVFIQLNDPVQTIGYVEQALAFYEPAGYRKEAARALLLLGRAKRQQGDYPGAIEIFKRQIRVAEELNDQSELASSHVSTGYLLGFYLEQYPAALDHFETSNRLYNEVGAKNRQGYNEMNRGRLLVALGRYDEARAALDRAMKIATDPNIDSKELQSFVYLANAQMALGRERPAEAVKESKLAVDLASRDQKEIAILSRYTHAIALARSGSARQARPVCEEAVSIAKESRNPRFTSEALLALAEVLLEDGEAQSALAAALEARAGFQPHGQTDSEWRALVIAARACRVSGDYQAMRAYAEQAGGLLTGLQQIWGDQAYSTYLSRPDVQNCRKQINQILAANK
jgi:tetratricopeptide (TPR) repeat protein